MLSEKETNYQTYPAKNPVSCNNGLAARNMLILAVVAQMYCELPTTLFIFYWIQETVHMIKSVLILFKRPRT